MFEQDLAGIASQIKAALAELGAPDPGEIKWQATPFAGQWGQGTNACFQAAAAEARAGRKVNVAAEKAYLNAYFDTPTYAARVVAAVLEAGADFGRGAPRTERVMVEYAQPNTHHSFHIGHARNAILGEALARLLEFAGYPTIRASYPGDIGLGVITILWAYDKFYRGQEPAGVHERGQWLRGAMTGISS